jgi:hypothetical protein
MPALPSIVKEWFRSYGPTWSVISLMMMLITSWPIYAGTLSSSRASNELTDPARFSASAIDASVIAIGSEVALQPGLVDGTRMLAPGKVLKEVGKQAIDQPGHFLIGAVPIWASRCLIGVPWYGWVAAPLLAYREWLQWPSNRWWDPPLDWIFLSLGAVVATFGRRMYGLADGVQPLRRRLVRSLSFLLATGRRARPVTT